MPSYAFISKVVLAMTLTHSRFPTWIVVIFSFFILDSNAVQILRLDDSTRIRFEIKILMILFIILGRFRF